MSTYRSKRTNKATGHRLGQILSNEEKLSIDRRVYLPFDLATVHAAAQNFRMELAKGTHHSLSDWDLYQSSYLADALEYLQDDGCNLYPGNNNEYWICAAECVGLIPMPSERAAALMELYDGWFTLDDVSLLKDPHFPCPSKVHDRRSLDAALANFSGRFCYH